MRSRFGCPPSRTEFFMLWTTRETGKRIVAGRSAACWAKFSWNTTAPDRTSKCKIRLLGPISHVWPSQPCSCLFPCRVPDFRVCENCSVLRGEYSVSVTYIFCSWSNSPPTLCPKSTAGTSFFTFLVCISWYGKFSKLRALWYAHWSQTDIQRKLWEVMKIFVSGREG